MTPTALGLQLGIFSSKYDLAAQPHAVLDAAVRAGYSSIECGLQDVGDPAAFRRLLDARHLTVAGLHITIWALQDLPSLIQTFNVLECADVCNSGLLTWDNLQAADYREAIVLLNEAGRELHTAGIFLHYHHHDFEFASQGAGISGMDILLKELEPNAVDLCVDVAWAQKGGQNPAAFLKAFGDRVGYLHLKDYRGDAWTALGYGELDIPEVLNSMPALPNLRQVVVEQDSAAGDPEEDATASRRYLRAVLGV